MDEKDQEKIKKRQNRDFVTMLIGPSIFGKAMILYFGLMYSANPDDGWGWALLFSVLFTVLMVARFLWRNRNYVD